MKHRPLFMPGLAAPAFYTGDNPPETRRRASFDHRSIQFSRFKRYCEFSKQNQTALNQ
ncbi:hypothetical protein ACN22W_32375 [Burkholderia theae]|uniref:hypothetical protein n=1 Tax=Burkholderia theae TaxID=3143496 RepID=UPI003AFB1C10